MPTPRSLNNARTHTRMAEKIGHSNNLFYSGRASATNIGFFSEKTECRLLRVYMCFVLVGCLCQTVSAQGLLHRADSLLTVKYHKGDIDTTYIVRPQTKWTVTARVNESGSKIKTEGRTEGQTFDAEIKADRKTTVSFGVSYLGFSLCAAFNPAKLLGKYRDYELNINSYGRRFGFDFIYQDAKNFTGWHDREGMERIMLPDGLLHVKTLNLNAFYVFNSRRFSYPAAFSQSYIQRHSAGSFLLGASGQGQKATLKWDYPMELKITNIGLGAGYGYNYVPGQGWLLPFLKSLSPAAEQPTISGKTSFSVCQWYSTLQI